MDQVFSWCLWRVMRNWVGWPWELVSVDREVTHRGSGR